nr:MAG TPA: hypothetical protein [Caudoviricetes sp.]
MPPCFNQLFGRYLPFESCLKTMSSIRIGRCCICSNGGCKSLLMACKGGKTKSTRMVESGEVAKSLCYSRMRAIFSS